MLRNQINDPLLIVAISMIILYKLISNVLPCDLSPITQLLVILTTNIYYYEAI